ncbi:MAG: DNA cytosine methyltransferase [Candidatus Anammoximicrobium sp.]|nr:DNA cytosine methyltransferase [Candidatus Anammoximicrobium sp.]
MVARDPDNTVVDIFCGAGGLSLGFQRAGFVAVAAFDHHPMAVETYRANLGTHVFQQEITEETGVPLATTIIGGPPCQGFSSAGMRRPDDSRNSLVACFARIVCSNRPFAFVFENVEGFLTAENGMRVFDLLRPVIAAGYCVHVRKVNAAHYGIPQHRKRVIAIGGLGWHPQFPRPTHSATGAPGADLVDSSLPSAPSVADAIAGLPPPSLDPPGIPPGHHYRPLTGIDLERAQALKPGQTMRDLPEELWHDSYRRRAFRRVMDGTPSDRRGGAPAGVKRLLPAAPSKTITGGATAEFLHPYEDRNLTIRECARIQTFPDDFVFCGSASEQAQLIGNAVPPSLATVVARQLAADLQHAATERKPGELLSFIPTLSNGMSPALEKVATKVRREFGRRQLELWG